MAGSSSQAVQERHQAVETALEAARLEVARRLTARGLPLTLQVPELQIKAEGERGGWASKWETVSISPLRNFNIQLAIQDQSVEHRILGLRPQLQSLAKLLNDQSDLGVQPSNFLPALTGVEAILARYVTKLANRYLTSLSTISEADDTLLAQLMEELDELVERDRIRHTNQLALHGVEVDAPLEHRGVQLRSLTPAERGQYFQSRSGHQLDPYQQPTDFVVPRDLNESVPSTLLEVTTSRSLAGGTSGDQLGLINRVALAFYLKDFVIASAGIIVGFDRPLWASVGQSHARSLVDQKFPVISRLITEAEFKAVVDLAHKMPEFGPAEGSSREVVLYRMLRGLGVHWQESGFLDFAVALEAALLKGAQTELSYRFALYGALFLRDERRSKETFDQLRKVYAVRSNLVHGSATKAGEREEALKLASDIGRAVTLRAIEHGWPDPEDLDRQALI